MIPESDDGTDLVLAVPTRLFCDYAKANFLEGLQEITGRSIAFEVRAWVGTAMEREQRNQTKVAHP